jgi:hypothetical protein
MHTVLSWSLHGRHVRCWHWKGVPYSASGSAGIHQARKYDMAHAPFVLTPENRHTFEQKRIRPFLSLSSLQSIEAFQDRMLRRVNQLVVNTPFQHFSLYRVIHATRNDLQKALLQQYASQAWNTDFFLSSLVSSGWDAVLRRPNPVCSCLPKMPLHHKVFRRRNCKV